MKQSNIHGRPVQKGDTKRLSLTDSSKWPRNRLLSALPSRSLEQIMSELELIQLTTGEVLADVGSVLSHVYFPDSGVISVLAVYEDGSTIEMATVGREGFADVHAVSGAKTSSARLLVQIPGTAARMSRASFAWAMGSIPTFRGMMHVYVHAFLEQVLLSGACNGAHSLKQRMARWLLMMRDRSDDDTLPITQDILAAMLGVQRPSVTIVARELENEGLIKRRRKQVTITQRKALIKASCECYQLVRTRFASYFPKTYL
jgi:CRP-like cAMP-binding protein